MTRYQNNITLPDIYDIQVEEKKILKFWAKEKIFEKIQNSRREGNGGKITFHSAPVFPTGYPHSGHILNSIVKDVFTRYKHKKNIHVESRFGWDCHGVAVEHEVDKRLGIRSPADIQKMGVAAYNEECRNFLQRHTSDWRNVFERTGNFTDPSEGYETMSIEYMQRVWWAFKQLHDKGLVYKDTKVLPYSTACFTHLSNFEAEQNCKEVSEVGYVISVDIEDSNEKLLIWTTTPWALVSNSAICVNPKSVYLKVKVNRPKEDEVVYILSKNRLPLVFKNPNEYEVLEEFLGETLQDLKYVALFKCIPTERNFSILLDESVPEDIGTGFVPLDEVVVESLKERGHVLNIEEVKHMKPHCWRSDTVLVKKQVESWFIRVKVLAEELLKNISQVNWIPDKEITEKHLINWLKEQSTDWSISRPKTWGTPIPIWSSPSGDEIVCVGSIEELKQLTGKSNITDLHRETVDWLKIPSRTPGNPPLRRIADVFDCWFESAVMPYVQENLNVHMAPESFEADCIAEGVDQTRGWFYTTLVLSTALSQPPPFRNVFATGLVLEPDGSKVSKRKHNHNDSLRLIEKYGADAFRLYLLSSPLVNCEGFTIQEDGVAEIVDTVIKPLYKLFYQCTKLLLSPYWVNYGYMTEWYYLKPPLNEWIISNTESVVKFYETEMEAYRLYNVLPKIFKLIQDVLDWYMPHADSALHDTALILFNVVYRLCLMLSPFAPFITEYIYRIYRPYIMLWSRKESIHDTSFYPPIEKVINPNTELGFTRMQTIVELGRTLRARHIVPFQYQIKEIVVIHHNEDYLLNVELFKDVITKHLNAQDMRTSKDHREFGAILKAQLKTNSALSSNLQTASTVQGFSDEEVESLIRRDPDAVPEQNIPLEDIQIFYHITKEPETNYAVITEEDLIVVMKMNKRLTFYEEGTVKELAHRIRQLKKKGNYYPSDLAVIYYSSKDKCLQNVMSNHGEHLNKIANCDLKLDEGGSTVKTIDGVVEEVVDIKGLSIRMFLYTKAN